MTSSTTTASTAPAYRQSIAGCLAGAIGEHGLSEAELGRWLETCSPALHALKADHATGRLPLLKIAEDTADLEDAEAAFARLMEGGEAVVFFGTGGSGLGGQTLAQLGGWNLPGVSCCADTSRPRPRTRFYDNLDPLTLSAGLRRLNLARTRFVVTSKSGGTTETLAQLLVALSAVKEAGLAADIPKMFLGITEPDKPGKTNGLRALLSSLDVPMLEHHTGIGGRFSCLTNVGLLPAIARGLDARKIRAGAREVVDSLVSSSFPAAFAPAIGAATAVGLSKERGIRTLVMMPYNDRLGRFSEWYVQLWAESLGKGGEGTAPIPALGPLDQHSQLQLFMDGPREIAVTVVRVASAGEAGRTGVPRRQDGRRRRGCAGSRHRGGVDAGGASGPHVRHRDARRTLDGGASDALHDRDDPGGPITGPRSVRPAGRGTRQDAHARTARALRLAPFSFLCHPGQVERSILRWLPARRCGIRRRLAGMTQ
jgi:glucose-6-phosphate isomerase